MKPVTLLSLLLLNSFVFSSESYAHNGHVFDASINACRALSVSDECQYESGGDKRFKGTCQVFNGTKLCVRNQPIEFIKGDGAKANTRASSRKQSQHRRHSPTPTAKQPASNIPLSFAMPFKPWNGNHFAV